ncbi:MAG: hypothetical protein U5O39_04875 [Gammaproteobacteria bacterium]|nr:hypothetical protein [Gammaproteobacteria bacterium]
MISIGLGATCNLPIAGYARIEEGEFVIAGYVSDLDGTKDIYIERTGAVAAAREISAEVVARLLDRGRKGAW